MKTVLPVLVLLTPAVCWAGLRLDICPRNFDVGDDAQTFKVTCIFKPTNTSYVSKLTSLTIKQYPPGGHRSGVTKVSINESNHLTYDTGLISARYERDEASYVSFRLYYPRTALAGEYACEAEGETTRGYGVMRKIGIVRAKKPTVNQMLKYYKAHHQSILRTMRQAYDVIQTGENRLRCCRAVQNSKHQVYRSSEARDGKRYYLSPETNILVLKEAEIQCRVLGGYLAEVDSEDELNFIRTFVEPLTDYDGIFIAGSDERSEGRWISAYRNTTVYLSWGSDQPNEGRSANCLCLWRDNDWRMADYQCDLDELVHKMGYLCEVEV